MSDPGRSATLAVDGVSLSFGGLAALSRVSFSVSPQSVLGIIGPNGSGKTSLLNCISGVYRPTEGDIRLNGRPISGLAPHTIARLGVGRTFQHVEIPKDLTVGELALLGRHTLMGRAGIASYGLGLPFFRGLEASHRAAAEAALEAVGMADLSEHYIGDLAYGLAKRADIARALAGEPVLLLLDEPAAGLNETERIHLGELVAKLVEGSLTVVLIEHDMTFVARACDRLLVLVQGHGVYEGSVNEALRDEAVIESFLGKAVVGVTQPTPDASRENN